MLLIKIALWAAVALLIAALCWYNSGRLQMRRSLLSQYWRTYRRTWSRWAEVTDLRKG